MNNLQFSFFQRALSYFFIILIIGCSPGNSQDEEVVEEVGDPYITAEIGGETWVGDTITRSGISVRSESQTYAVFSNNDRFGVYLTITDSPYSEEGIMRKGKYTGTKVFFEFAHLYGPYAIQAYFQGDRTTNDHVIEITHSDGRTISGTFSGTFIKGVRNYPPVVDENSPDQIVISNGKFRNMPLDLYPTSTD